MDLSNPAISIYSQQYSVTRILRYTKRRGMGDTPLTPILVSPPAPSQNESRGSKTRSRRILLFILEKLVLPFVMVIVSVAIFTPIQNWWVGPDHYTIYLVGRAEQPEIMKMFAAIHTQSELAKLRIDGREIEVEEVDDHGEISEAKDVAADLSKRPDTLMVVGHVLSQSTLNAVPAYMSAKPPVPVIATRETSDDLLRDVKSLQCKHLDVYCPLLPMSPTDADQVETAVAFLNRQNSKSFLLVVEENHHNAEHYASLEQEFQDKIRDRHGNIVRTMSVSDSSSVHEVLSTIIQNKVPIGDRLTVLFIGQTDMALSLVNAITTGIADQAKRPLIMVSDSAVGDALKSAQAEVYAMFPLSGVNYESASNVYGIDAVKLISALVKQVNDNKVVAQVSWLRHIVNMHRVVDSREAIIREMHMNSNNGTVYAASDGRTYRYVAKYELQNIHFHIWLIKERRIHDVDDQDPDLSASTAAGLTLTVQSKPQSTTTASTRTTDANILR